MRNRYLYSLGKESKDMKKSVAIIGGGVSGFAAGIYALQSGYEATIYEKNPMAGGECTGWNRQGYHIDNCVHFLVGCSEKDELNKVWKNIGVITDATILYREPSFYCLDMNGERLHLWRDIEKAKEEFLRIAPEDERELTQFFDCVKGCECIKPPCEQSPAHMSWFQYAKLGLSMKPAGKANKEYGKQTMADFVERFKNPYLKALFGNYFNKDTIALTFLTSYAFYTSDTVAIPEGGSTGMIARIENRFQTLGGRLNRSSEVTDVVLEQGHIRALRQKDGTEIVADNYIWACDPEPLFRNMLDSRFMDPNLKHMYDHPEGYAVKTGYQAAFGISTEDELLLPAGSVIFPCEEYIVANEKHTFCGMRVYDYDKTIYPQSKRVIQCNILQSANDYDYWETLSRDKPAYEKEKERIAEELKIRLETQYPQLKGNLILLGTYSPITFHRWCNAYKGGYMSFDAGKGFKRKYVKNTVQGIDNLFLAGQWLQNGGGLPIAVTEGKFAVDAMLEKDRHHC